MARTRQLAAIMFCQIDAYDALMRQNEPEAVALKSKHREVLHQVATKFHGKILQDAAYDSLTLFPSAVEAVQCAMEMQFSFQEEPGVPVKIGIHLGDIIYSEEEAIGDGIIVARKIESQAVPGSILVSNKIYEEVKNQPGILTRFIKACDLDDQAVSVKVYAIANEGLVLPPYPGSGNDMSEGEGRSYSRIRHFWEEARRRNVIRVVSIYAAAAYVSLEITSIISDSLNMPDWVMTAIILLLSILFIVLAVWSWIYDITPDGIKKTGAPRATVADPDSESRKEGGNWFARNKVFRRYLVPLLVIVILVGFYFFKDRIFQNWERVNKEAREHTEKAILFIKNQADPVIIKSELDMALEADPEYSLALHTYAMVHRLEGDTVLAKEKLHQILRADAGYSKAWDLLASYAFWQDSFELAMGYSIKAIEADPGNTFAAYNMAIQSEDRGLYNQAVEWYRKAVEMDSTFTPGYSALGALYNKMNRPTEAILTLRRSLRISPASMDNFRVYKNLGEAHFLLQEYDKTLEYLEESKALNPDYPDTELCFARYYESAGEIETSIRHWRRYLALERDSSKLQEMEQHLDSLRLQVPK